LFLQSVSLFICRQSSEGIQLGAKLESDPKKDTDPEERYTDIGKVKIVVDDTEATETNTEFLNPVYSEGEATQCILVV